MKCIEEIATYPFPFVHPEDMDPFDRVQQFSAVISKDLKLINSNDYISYKSGSEVSQSAL